MYFYHPSSSQSYMILILMPDLWVKLQSIKKKKDLKMLQYIVYKNL